MVRGEIPIELGASWFSPKCVEAQPRTMSWRGVKHVSVRAARAVPNRNKLRILFHIQDVSETVGDKVHCQEGNSPDHQLRPQNEY